MNVENPAHADLERLICKYLKDNEKIEKFQFNITSNLNDTLTFISKVIDVVVCGENNYGEKKKLRFFIKMANIHNGLRKLFTIKQLYLKEIYFYKEIVPIFNALQETRKIVHQFKSYPAFYTSSDVNQKEIVILESLLERGFKISNRCTALDYDHALLVMKELGRFHALSFAARDQLPLIFKRKFYNLKDLEYHGNYGELTKLFTEAILSTFINSVRCDSKGVARKINEIKDTFFATVKTAVEHESAEPYTVITHSDFWTSNLLFKYDDSSHPCQVCIVDFQAAKLCTPIADVSQFMLTCIERDTRKKYYKDLILQYYNCLSSFLRELGSDPDELFPFDIFENHLKKFSVIGLALALKIIFVNSIASENMPNIEEVEDGASICQLYIDATKNLKYYTETIENLVIDYTDFGNHL